MLKLLFQMILLKIITTGWQSVTECHVEGSHSGGAKDSSLPEFDAMSTGK